MSTGAWFSMQEAARRLRVSQSVLQPQSVPVRRPDGQVTHMVWLTSVEVEASERLLDPSAAGPDPLADARRVQAGIELLQTQVDRTRRSVRLLQAVEESRRLVRAGSVDPLA